MVIGIEEQSVIPDVFQLILRRIESDNVVWDTPRLPAQSKELSYQLFYPLIALHNLSTHRQHLRQGLYVSTRMLLQLSF